MNYKEAISNATQMLNDIMYVRSLSALLMWDQWNTVPVLGKTYAGNMNGFVSNLLEAKLETETAKETLTFFESLSKDDFESDVDYAIIRVISFYTRGNGESDSKLSQMLQIAIGEAQVAWVQATQMSDYKIFKPKFKNLFETNLKFYQTAYSTTKPYEEMMKTVSTELSLEDVNLEFNKLRDNLTTLLSKINASKQEIRTDFLERQFDKEQLRKFVEQIVLDMGYDLNKGAFGEVMHGFSAFVGPRDARIAGNYNSFRLGLFSLIHEMGHAMYSYRTRDDLVAVGLWGGKEGGFHEAQSRFYENIIAKSRAFSEFLFPKLQKEFTQFSDVTLDEYYKAINAVVPSSIRIVADEVTYSLHPIIRFELEQELINGITDFDSLPNRWNDKYKEYLGVEPQNDVEGVLQDMHWAIGGFGFFGSYILGNLYGGQILHTLERQVPTVFDDIKEGNFNTLNDWFTENIHQYGLLYTESEMIEKSTGEKLNADYFVAYLNKKYGEIYGF